jgi:hypothetical protein
MNYYTEKQKCANYIDQAVNNLPVGEDIDTDLFVHQAESRFAVSRKFMLARFMEKTAIDDKFKMESNLFKRVQ